MRAHRGPLGDGLHQCELVELLKCTSLCLDEWSRATDDDERDLSGIRVGDPGDGARDAGPGGDHSDTRAASYAAIRLGGMRRRLLVSNVEDADAFEPAPLVDRHDVPAREREDRVDSLGCDRTGDESPALRALGHDTSLDGRSLASARVDLDLVFLGTAASAPTARRATSATLIRRGGERLLVDCGEGTQRQLLRSDAGLIDLDAIFLTHLHGDHFLGLPGLLKT